MDKQAKSQFEIESKKYIEEKKVFDVLEGLMRKLIVAKPDNPLDFLIGTISNKIQNYAVFVIGKGFPTEDVCNNISLQHNLKRISVEKIIQHELKYHTEIGKAYLNSGGNRKLKS